MENNTPLVSVIVPIYNAIPYLNKCLDSLKNQTMKEIEVIMIDDGSTDGSGSIADNYVSDTFPIFKVIHTKNQGVSAARNRGIDEASAKFLLFVDSDDWVSIKICELTYKNAINTNSDIIMFDRYLTDVNGKILKDKNRIAPKGPISHELAIDFGGAVIWNKLYKKTLFDTIRFPDGLVYEDHAIVHNLIYKANNLICIDDKLYYYRYRTGSICHSEKGDLDLLIISKKRYGELVEHGYPEEKAKGLLFISALRCCARAKDKNSYIYEESCRILNHCKHIPVNFTKKDKIKFIMWKINPDLYRYIYKKCKS